MRAAWSLIFLFVLVAVAAGLLVLSPEQFERAPSLCLWRHLFGLRCPGCGSTRAMSASLHLRFADAMAYNPLIGITGPLAAGAWLAAVWRCMRRLRAARRYGRDDAANSAGST